LGATGNLYGTTNKGGVNGYGTVFELPAGGSAAVALASFQGGVYGGNPGSTPVLDQNGDIFVTTYTGGFSNGGTVLEIAKGSSTLTPVTLSFDTTADGGGVGGTLVIDGNGNIYGNTTDGGAHGLGTIFEIVHGTTTVTPLAALDSNSGGLGGLAIDGSGNLYWAGVTGFFELSKGSTTITPLGSFGQTAASMGPPVFDANGNLYVATLLGLFELPRGSAQVVSLFTFNGTAAAGGPQGGIAMDGNGDFFGTNYGRGPAGFGSVFELSTVNVNASAMGTSGADVITLSQSAEHHNVQWSIDGGQPFNVPIDDPNGLTIGGAGGTDVITLDYTNGNPLPTTLHLNGTFTINGLQGTNPFAGSNLEIGQSTVYINYSGGTSPVAQIRQALSDAFGGRTWNGVGGANGMITSLTAATGPVGVFGIGYADSADGMVSGQPGNTVEIRYTVMGDANLDRVVNSTDAILMARNYLIAGRSAWDLGNFNYDSTINLSDAMILQKNFNATASGSVVVAAATAEAVNSGAGVWGGGTQSNLPVSTSTSAVTGGGSAADTIGGSGTTPDAPNQNHKPKRHAKQSKRG
jgi:uncharacterized repeat protein (TIGR03803 family)